MTDAQPAPGAEVAVPRPAALEVPRDSALEVPRPAVVAVAPSPRDRAVEVFDPPRCGCPPAVVGAAGHLAGCPG